MNVKHNVLLSCLHVVFIFSQQTSEWYVEFVFAAYLNHGVDWYSESTDSGV